MPARWRGTWVTPGSVATASSLVVSICTFACARRCPCLVTSGPSGCGAWLCGLPWADPPPPPTSCQTPLWPRCPHSQPRTQRAQGRSASRCPAGIGTLVICPSGSVPPPKDLICMQGTGGVCFLEGVQVGEKGETAIQWEISRHATEKLPERNFSFYF